MKQKQRRLVQEFGKLIRVVLFMLTRERVPPTKKNILNRMMYLNFFREYRESKANPNFNHVTAYVKKFSTSIKSDFYVSLYYWKEGTTSQNEDFLIPRHDNAKNQQQQYIIELTVKQLAKPELCSVKTSVLH